jgi:EmrB/QacA subfamily drug resistance transporter
MSIIQRLRANPWVVLVVLCLGLFMALLDTTIVNVAVPSIIEGIDASFDEILWVLNAYVLVFAALLITSGRLGDIFGPKRLFLAGMALFTVASAFCGLAQDPTQLIIARALQGVAGALMSPQPMAIITSIFPPERRGAALAIPGILGGLAVAAGPIVGGFLITNFGWPSIFYVNVPVGVVALTLAALVVPDIRPGRRHRLDMMGVLLATAGVLGITFGLIEGERYNWGGVFSFVSIPQIIGAGVLLMLVFLATQYLRQDREPLLPFELFKDRNYSLMTLVAAAMGFAMLGLFLPLTIYLQSVLGLSALQAGLTVLPQPLVMMFVAGPAGSLSDRVGGKYVLVVGLALFAASMGYLDWTAQADSGRWSFLPALILMGVGLGLTWAPMYSLAMRDVEPRIAGAAAGVIETIQELGGVIAGAVVGAYLQNRLAVALREQAIERAEGLPPQFRDRFVDGFSVTAEDGLEVGGRQTAGGAQLPQQVQQLAEEVFRSGFVEAMHPTLAIPTAIVLLAAISSLAVQRRKGKARADEAEQQPEEVVARETAVRGR